MLGAWWKDFKGILTDPFDVPHMPASHWFMLVGIVLISVLIWNVILIHILSALEAD